ncbi:MAG TPA: hypothetical protein VFC84_03565 [Desulfosporosinus sp.]|nr:hypothetical protein [Desulfosporosinus sp.]
MKKALTLISMIIIIFVSGCNSQTKSIPEELKGVRLNQQFSITSEDNEKYIGKIQFQNTTTYDFLPIAVSVRYQIRYLENGVDTMKPNPIQLQTERIFEQTTKKEFTYKVEIPKKLFDVYEDTDKENVEVTIEGIFSKNDRIVLEVSEGGQGRLVKD